MECPGGAQNPCNGNGLCTAEGTCACFHGYRNSDCSKKCPGGLEAYLDGNQIVARECSGKLAFAFACMRLPVNTLHSWNSFLPRKRQMQSRRHVRV
jgi:hypothetical protein